MAMQEGNPTGTDVARELEEFIRLCMDCAKLCQQCAVECIEAGSKGMARCIRLCLDCADLCTTAAALMSRTSSSTWQPAGYAPMRATRAQPSARRWRETSCSGVPMRAGGAPRPAGASPLRLAQRRGSVTRRSDWLAGHDRRLEKGPRAEGGSDRGPVAGTDGGCGGVLRAARPRAKSRAAVPLRRRPGTVRLLQAF